MIIDFKDCHDRHGNLKNKELMDFLLENPETVMTIEVSNWLRSTTMTEHVDTMRGEFKNLYVGEYFDNDCDVITNIFDNDYEELINLRINYAGLGYFGGPYLKSVLIDIDEETLFYLKMKGL